MASSSPSEFLTFYRRLATSQSLRYRSVPKTSIRQFAASTRCRADTGDPHITTNKGTHQDTSPGKDIGGSREHALDKGNKKDPNIQSAESSFGRRYVETTQTDELGETSETSRRSHSGQAGIIVVSAARTRAQRRRRSGDGGIVSSQQQSGSKSAGISPSEDMRTLNLSMRTGAEAWETSASEQEETYADIKRKNSARANDDGGPGTKERDPNNSTEKAKKDHPEAPDTVIGMQDERGGKGLHS